MPWSLVGSSATDETALWYAEAERKHGRIAALAVANWLVLSLLGEISPTGGSLCSRLPGFLDVRPPPPRAAQVSRAPLRKPCARKPADRATSPATRAGRGRCNSAVAPLEASTFHASTTELTGPRAQAAPGRPFHQGATAGKQLDSLRPARAHARQVDRASRDAGDHSAGPHADFRWTFVRVLAGAGAGLVSMAASRIRAQSPAASNMADVSASSNLAASLASDITTLGDILDPSGG